MQSLAPTPVYRGVMNTLTEMVRTEGVFRPVRGMSAVMIGAGPAHALYFACYEKIKEVLASNRNAANYNNLIYG
jgi:solute carrier family 25 iron transporter 28/37